MKHSWVLFVMSVLALAGTARAASTLYAATGIGPFKSTGSGVTWKQLIVTSNDSSFPGVPKILVITVDPQTPSTVYALPRYIGPSGFRLAFLKSTDSVATWSVVSKPTFPFTSGAGLLAIDPVKTNVLYTMNFDSGIDVSADWGSHLDRADDSQTVRVVERRHTEPAKPGGQDLRQIVRRLRS
jgi:hypothetical protein